MAAVVSVEKPLHQVADIVRSKNAGPYRITFDVLFRNPEHYSAIRDAGVITPARIAAAYGLPVEAVSSFFAIDMANAFKITIVRPCPQGQVGDGDMYGCQQHVPLMNLPVPAPAGA